MRAPDRKDFDTPEDYEEAREEYEDYLDYMYDEKRDDEVLEYLDK